MNTVLAWVCFLLGIAFYGILVAWIANLGGVAGFFQIPNTLRALGWEAAVYGIGLIVLGSTFLFAGAALMGRRR